MAQSHVKGGFYIRRDAEGNITEAVDADGKPIENGVELAEKMDREAQREAKRIAKQQEEQATAGVSGAFINVIRTAMAAATGPDPDGPKAEPKTGREEPLDTETKTKGRGDNRKDVKVVVE